MSAGSAAFSVRRQTDRHGTRVYAVEVEAYPALLVNSFVIVEGDPAAPSYTALVDFGSERAGSFAGLTAGLQQICSQYGESVSLAGLSRLVLTHAHPDHVGGLPQLRQHTGAPLAAHRLAAEVLADPAAAQARSDQGQARLRRWAGVPEEDVRRFESFVRRPLLPQAFGVDDPLEDGDLLDGRLAVKFTPGHCANQICLQLNDLLFTADHVLPDSLPPITPLRQGPGLGLEEYLDALDHIMPLRDVRLALPGHGEALESPSLRIAQIRGRFEQKLLNVLDACDTPRTVLSLLEELYPGSTGNRRNLLLAQTGALCEYLAHHGLLAEQSGTRRGERTAGTPAEPTVQFVRTGRAVRGPLTRLHHTG